MTNEPLQGATSTNASNHSARRGRGAQRLHDPIRCRGEAETREKKGLCIFNLPTTKTISHHRSCCKTLSGGVYYSIILKVWWPKREHVGACGLLRWLYGHSCPSCWSLYEGILHVLDGSGIHLGARSGAPRAAVQYQIILCRNQVPLAEPIKHVNTQGKTWRGPWTTAIQYQRVLVDVCLHDIMGEYRIFLKNLSFLLFFKLMKAARRTNESV